MKKLLSILGIIGLTATSTTTLISCEKPNNNENEGGNKPEPTPKPEKSQEPPVKSNWKLVNDIKNEFKEKNNKWYFIIFGAPKYQIKKWLYNDNKIVRIINYSGNLAIIFDDLGTGLDNISIYRWNGDGKPTTPTIDKNTGKITDWKE